MTNHYQNREYNKSDEDENYSWRDVREEMGLSRYMEMEDEDYLELVTDGNGNEEEIEGEDQADWAMKWISEDLTNYFEESGDIWVMIYQSDSLEPIMHVDEENIYISPDYDPDNDSSIEIDGEEFELSPVPILQETGYALELLDKDYVVQEIPDRPELEH